MKHIQPIITNARMGRPISINKPRISISRWRVARLMLALALVFFWITVLILLLK